MQMCPSLLITGCFYLQCNSNCSYYYLLLHVTANYWYLKALKQDSNVHWQQHGVDIQAATIGSRRWEVEAPEIFCTKLVKKGSSGGSAAHCQLSCRTAPCWCWSSRATSTHPNLYCDSHSQAVGGWCYVSTVHWPSNSGRGPLCVLKIRGATDQ